MKRNILKIMTLCTVAVLALASCKKDNKPQANVPENGFLATIEQPTGNGNGNRTHINPDWANDATTDILWTAEDLIKVANGNGTVLNYQITEGENTSNGVFYTGEPHETFFVPNYAAIYPAFNAEDVANGISGTTATFNVPQTQTYRANSFAEKSMPMVAYSTDQTLAFKNVFGGICIPLVGDGLTVTRVVLTSAADEALWGTCTTTISTTGGDPTSSMANVATGKNSLTLDCSATPVTLDATTPTYFCFMVPAGSLANGFTVTVYDEETQLDEKTTTANPSITRSVISKPNSSLEIICPCSFGPAGFTVGMDGDTPRRVFFAPANLQYQASTGTWRFAENQWDYIGNAAGNNTAEADRPTQAAWIDLFGWGTSGYDNTANDPYAINFQPWASSTSTVNTTYNYYGYGPSTNMTDPSLVGTSANYDWGVYNAIYNPKTNTTDAAGTWRTLTNAEWTYVLNTRTTCSGVRYAKAVVNGVNGLIIVPDNWDVNIYPLQSTNTAGANYTTNNNISSSQWTSIFEPAGCAFLPAAGYRDGTSVNNAGSNGGYWSATYNGSYYAYGLYFYSGGVGPSSGSHYRYYGRSVRLVRSAE